MFVWTSTPPPLPPPAAIDVAALLAELAARERTAPTEAESDLEYIRRAR